ncbi:MAG TPA: alpha-amylase family glycosyl hydrolase [Actinomycetota bacterium]|nr:alpha-amylase family glycosyl hydrolase [Actinomycetota bacterium]
METPATSTPWWRDGVIYQIYVRSFADSNDDGVGDLQGIVERLDHLEWLGVDAIWLSPVTPSPNADWGYDVADYTDVDPELGDLETLDRLIADAAGRGILVLLDLVPNHTSDRHPWFVDARSGRDAAHRDWYVWADPGPDGGPPNNWRSTFGGPAWTWDEGTEQYYLHNFLAEQPDLNWWNDEVHGAFDDVLAFWFDRGIAGFRIDVANGLIKDRELRNNPAVTEDDPPRVRALGVRPVYNANRPEVHDVYRRWRGIAGAYEPARVLIGETWLFDLAELMRYYGAGDELDLAMNFRFVFAEFGPPLREVVESSVAAMPEHAWPVWVASNHDAGRLATRWAGGDERKVRLALMLLLTLRGTPILYYGDEIGMPEVALSREDLLDPVGIRGWPEEPGRDPSRTPMQWTSGPGAGFTGEGVRPWLPIGDAAAVNVADQRDDASSVLHLVRDLIALRRSTPDLRTGPSSDVEAPAGVWAWRRASVTLVALNLSDEATESPLPAGTILVGTDHTRAGERVGETLRLGPWEGAVIGLGDRADA